MNPQTDKRSPMAYASAIIGSFLIIAALAYAMRRQTEPAPIDQNRKLERAKALAEVRAAEAQALSSPAWIDKGKEIVRLPIDVAMQATVLAWQDPKAAKADLVARVQKATFVPPPEPAKPSEFE